MRDYVLIQINGKSIEVRGDKASMMLADFLRYELGLTGTKIVCAEGDCGACTVLRRTPFSKTPYYESLNSCITTVAQMDASSLVSIDAIENENQLSPPQQAMVDCNASQCGFCTPGFVMALTGLVEKKLSRKEKSVSPQEAKNTFTGNLCRCTGYQPIVDAACKTSLDQCQNLSTRYLPKAQMSELKKVTRNPIQLQGESFSFFAPTKLKQACLFLAKNPDARLVGGGTDLGVLVNKGKLKPIKFLSLHLIPELYEIKKTKDGKLRVGARVSLSELRKFCEGKVPEFARFLDIFASPQIKNVATLIGNIGNASPIADTPPFLLVTNAIQTLVGPRGSRKLALDKFYLGYKKVNLKKGELVSYVEFEIPQKNENLALYKSSQRKDLDISTVNAAFRFKTTGTKISSARAAFGGVGPIPYRLKKLERFLEGKELNMALVENAVILLQKEILPLDDLRGTASFRRVVAENFFRKFCDEVVQGKARPV